MTNFKYNLYPFSSEKRGYPIEKSLIIKYHTDNNVALIEYDYRLMAEDLEDIFPNITEERLIDMLSIITKSIVRIDRWIIGEEIKID